MRTLLLIGAGGFLGSILWFSLSQFIQTRAPSAFPFGTLGVNLIGCFVIGVIFALGERFHLNKEWQLFLATGICGGFTTFSAFSYETFSMLRVGHLGMATAYIVASVLLGVLATFIGYTVLKFV